MTKRLFNSGRGGSTRKTGSGVGKRERSGRGKEGGNEGKEVKRKKMEKEGVKEEK